MAQNPLWKPPEKWKIVGKPSKRVVSPRRIDEKIVKMLQRAQRKAYSRRDR